MLAPSFWDIDPNKLNQLANATPEYKLVCLVQLVHSYHIGLYLSSQRSSSHLLISIILWTGLQFDNKNELKSSSCESLCEA